MGDFRKSCRVAFSVVWRRNIRIGYLHQLPVWQGPSPLHNRHQHACQGSLFISNHYEQIPSHTNDSSHQSTSLRLRPRHSVLLSIIFCPSLKSSSCMFFSRTLQSLLFHHHAKHKSGRKGILFSINPPFLSLLFFSCLCCYNGAEWAKRKARGGSKCSCVLLYLS